MQMKGRHVAGLSAVASVACLLQGFDASAQDAKKPQPKATSPCKGLDEKACRGRATECIWIVPTKGKQKPYCRLKPASKKKS